MTTRGIKQQVQITRTSESGSQQYVKAGYLTPTGFVAKLNKTSSSFVCPGGLNAQYDDDSKRGAESAGTCAVLAGWLVEDRRCQDRYRPAPDIPGAACPDRRFRRHRLGAFRHIDGHRPAVDGRLRVRRIGQAHPDHPQHRGGGDFCDVHSVLPRLPSPVASVRPELDHAIHQGLRTSCTCSFPASSSAAS